MDILTSNRDIDNNGNSNSNIAEILLRGESQLYMGSNMERHKIVVIYTIYPYAIKILEKVGGVIVPNKLVKSKEELISLAGDADARLL